MKIIIVLALGLVVELVFGHNQQSQSGSSPFSFNVPPGSNLQSSSNPTSPNLPMMLLMINMMSDGDSGMEMLLPMMMMGQSGGAFDGNNMMFQMMMVMMATKNKNSINAKCLEDLTHNGILEECLDKYDKVEEYMKCVKKKADEVDCADIACQALCFSHGKDDQLCKYCKLSLFEF